MEPPSGTARGGEGEDDWELCNDDGFVYRRKKRRVDSNPDATAGTPEVPDPEVEERNQREWKRRILLNLKRKYEREINLWENLSTSLRFDPSQVLKRRQEEQRQRLEAEETASLPEPSPGGAGGPTGDAFARPSLLDELLSLAKTQEAAIRDVSKMCDVAEAMCKGQEEQLSKPLFDLPVWGSPRELMASLCDE